jgi:hypothetical protein
MLDKLRGHSQARLCLMVANVENWRAAVAAIRVRHDVHVLSGQFFGGEGRGYAIWGRRDQVQRGVMREGAPYSIQKERRAQLDRAFN